MKIQAAVFMLAALQASPALADTVTYNLTGIINSGGDCGLPHGQKFAISIHASRPYAAQTSKPGERVFSGTPGPLSAITVDGSYDRAVSTSVTVKKTSGGSSYTLVANGPGSNEAYTFTLSSSMASAVPDLRIPKVLRPSRFQHSTITYQIQDGTSCSGPLFD